MSYRRRILHGKIDILRAELVNRLRKKHEEGGSVISGADVQQLTDILAGKGIPLGRRARVGRRRACTAPSADSPTPKARTTARSAARSSARPRAGAATRPRSTRSTRPATSCRRPRPGHPRGRHAGDPLRRRARRVRRSRSSGERMTIGRSPEAEVFLDDVTVSRNHALLVRRRDGLYVDDLGSLNGTYVNQHRIESHRLAGRRRAPGRQVQAHLPGPAMSTEVAGDPPPAQGEGAHDRRRRASSSSASSPTSRSRRSATSRTRSCSRRAARRAATGSTRQPTWIGCARSCASSATSSCRCA